MGLGAPFLSSCVIVGLLHEGWELFLHNALRYNPVFMLAAAEKFIVTSREALRAAIGAAPILSISHRNRVTGVDCGLIISGLKREPIALVNCWIDVISAHLISLPCVGS